MVNHDDSAGESTAAAQAPDTPAAATAPTDARPAWGQAIFWTLLSLAGAWWLYQLYLSHPVRYALLLNEDGMLEYATATCFLVAAAASLWTALRTTGGMRRLVCAFIGFGFFVVGMEEMSWGQRILGFETPEAMKAINRQEELTLHNVVSGHLINDLIVTTVLIWLVVSAVLWKTGKTEKLHRSGWPLASLATAGVFLLVAALLHWTPRPRYQEGTEAFLGAAILVWTVERMMRYTASRSLDWRRSGIAMLVALVMASGLAYGMQKKYPSWTGWVLNTLAHDYYLPRGHYEQAAEVYAFIEENPKNLVPESYVSHLRALHKLGRDAEKTQLGELAITYYRGRIEADASPENIQLLARSYNYLDQPDRASQLFTEASLGFEAAYAQATTDDERAEVVIAEARMLLWSDGVPAALAKMSELDALDVSPHIDQEAGVWRNAISLSTAD